MCFEVWYTCIIHQKRRKVSCLSSSACLVFIGLAGVLKETMEFKMKDVWDPAEVLQAAKYSPYLEIMFGEKYEIIPALVLTKASDFFEFVPIGNTDAVLPVCSGDMLFNVFNEYLGFLAG